MKLYRAEIENLIPHREPMLLIDAATCYVPGESAVAEWYVSPDWNILEGHFPGNRVVPGIYLIEAMAQTVDVAILSKCENAGKAPYLFRVLSMTFLRQVLPGTLLTFHSEKISENDGYYEFNVSAASEEGRVATGKIVIRLV